MQQHLKIFLFSTNNVIIEVEDRQGREGARTGGGKHLRKIVVPMSHFAEEKRQFWAKE